MPKGPGDEVLGGTINAGDETLEVPCASGVPLHSILRAGGRIACAPETRAALCVSEVECILIRCHDAP